MARTRGQGRKKTEPKDSLESVPVGGRGSKMSPEEGSEYETMTRLESIESLLEELDELGLKSREELVAEIEKLRASLDWPDSDAPPPTSQTS